ncbi:28S ribosomal protein S36, mitochondrial isoform X2 [Pristis pectinata]|uniref:28S ribosomal protein S36, mitochondrial isoform X2 n=1 Tax=Pristis pectinata TaxID=685728 RepID=UPI00223DB7D3|nr:28S ribosomal protein S36, mitochondrial isoform X2 [Pristis pectinata]
MLTSVAMGNSWGSKMAAVSRSVQIVKPHQRLIKFPDRKASPQPNVREALKSMSVSIQRQQPTTTNSLSSAAAPISQLPGTRDTVEIVRALPQKYRRLPVSQEEMEYIQRGGPE